MINQSKLDYKREYMREWHRKNPEKYPEYYKKWYLANREKILAKSRYRYKSNAVERSKKIREWRSKNPDKIKIYARRWKPSKEKVNSYNRTKYADTPEKFINKSHKRRALIRSVTTKDCSNKIRQLMRERFCHWCCVRLTKEIRSIDHVIPLSRGGKHIPDNLVAACRSCNCSKNDKLVEEWTWKMAV